MEPIKIPLTEKEPPMKKGLNKATLIDSCDTCQQAEWFVSYLVACQFVAEARGRAVYACDMCPTQVSVHWNDFVTNWQPRLRSKRDKIQWFGELLTTAGFELAKVQGLYLRTPSAHNYKEQERLSLVFQEAYQNREHEQEAYQHLASFEQLAQEVKTRLAHNARVNASDKALMPMARRIWAEEAAEKKLDKAG